jgi:drug/metabolite transporter (DMT)-like permease
MPLNKKKINLIAALLIIYIIWGSTYLAIRFMIETLPPLLMSGFRFFIAGVILFVFARFKGTPLPSRKEFFSSAIIGLLLLLGGNGCVVYSEQIIPSGIAALIVSTVPVWFALFNWLFFAKKAPDIRTVLGLFLGIGGIILLIGPGELMGAGRINLTGAFTIMCGSVMWSIGSLYAGRAKLPESPFMFTALQMLTGGAGLFAAGSIRGEFSMFSMESVTARSFLSFAYLLTFGSLIAYTSYSWLVRNAKPGLVSTYAFVNPVVAVILGWALANEELNLRSMTAALIIISGVVLIILKKNKKQIREAP